jgi:hypothetical protein
MLQYSLHENPLTKRKDDFSARTRTAMSYDRDRFIDLMLQRGTLLTKTDIVAVFNDMEETMAYIMNNGGSVSLPLLKTSFSISGAFNGATDSFDPLRHKVHVKLGNGVLLRDLEKKLKPEKVNVPSPQPQILEVKDILSGKVDEVLTSGGVVEIEGIRIKLSGNKPTVGLWFVDENGAEIKAETIVANKPKQIIALIPSLTVGATYRLKIVTQFFRTKDLKEPRVTVFDLPFTAL